MLNFERKVEQKIFFGLHLNAWIKISPPAKVEMETITKIIFISTL